MGLALERQETTLASIFAVGTGRPCPCLSDRCSKLFPLRTSSVPQRTSASPLVVFLCRVHDWYWQMISHVFYRNVRQVVSTGRKVRGHTPPLTGSIDVCVQVT